jgi:RNA recognition motif-containing protein
MEVTGSMVKTLYVGNIPWSTSESDLEQVFAQYGEVLECRIITERATGRSRGYGFVEVNENDAEQIMEKTNGLEIEGRKLVVNEAKPREQQ